MSSITVRVLLLERVPEAISESEARTMTRAAVADTADRVKTYEPDVLGPVAQDTARTARSVSRSPRR